MTNETKAYLDMMKAEGWKVYTRGHGRYCYCTDGTHIAYVQWSDRPHVSTVHFPHKKTGTGFHIADEITPATIRQAMLIHAPSWAQEDARSVRKYADWDAFHNSNGFNLELKES